MSKVSHKEVSADEDGLRLDRWFKRHFPGLSHGRLEKSLRKGEVRVDGGRAKAGLRLEAGQTIRIPPLSDEDKAPRAPKRQWIGREEADKLRALVLYKDDDILVINKPAGLAVQGGTKITRHLDGMLEALKFGAPVPPRLVHRLDKDTSGVLVLARNVNSAARMAEIFRRHETRKIYWAFVIGVPRPEKGRIDLALSKKRGHGGERVATGTKDARKAVTLYATVDTVGRKAAWLALWPITGRTHQLRVHCTEIGVPIQGDGKYGGRDSFLDGEDIPPQLHLHAREKVLPLGKNKENRVTAPLPDHMVATWKLFGLPLEDDGDPFAGVEVEL